MGRIEHRRKACDPLPIRPAAVPECAVETVRHVVAVRPLTIYEAAEISCLPPPAAVDRRWVVVAGLAHHVGKASRLNGFDQLGELIQ